MGSPLSQESLHSSENEGKKIKKHQKCEILGYFFIAKRLNRKNTIGCF